MPDADSFLDAPPGTKSADAFLDAPPKSKQVDLPAWAGGEGSNYVPPKQEPRPSVSERMAAPFREALTGPDTASAAAKRYFSRSPSDTLNTVNQAVVGPLATVFVDAPNAVLRGASGGLAGVAEALGLPPASSDRLERSLNAGADAASLELGRDQIAQRGVMAPAVEASTGERSAARAATMQGGQGSPPPIPSVGTRLAAGKVSLDIDSAARKQRQAAEVVEKRVNQGVSDTGTTAQEVLDKLNKARELGKPVSITDVGGAPVKGLAGTVARRPGQSQATMERFYTQRDTGAPERLTADVGRDLASGPSTYRTEQVLKNQRQAESTPLYEKAFQGGSLAPLKDQFEQAFNEASRAEVEANKRIADAQTRLTQAQARSVQAGNNVYANSGAHQDLQAAQIELRTAQRAAADAAHAKQSTIDQLRQAQDDIATNKPGAVWNPFIQQIMEDPITKGGIAKGLELERLDALHNRTRFDPTEYAMVPDGNGGFMVGKVPNMRLLDAAKKGMDAIIGEERGPDGRLSMRGRAVDAVRRDLLNELDTINPDYAKARAAWSGPSASIDAANWGRSVARALGSDRHGFSDEEIADYARGLNPNDMEFARYGLADGLLAKIKTSGFGGDEAKRIIRSEWSKGQLKPFFRTEKDYENFVESVGIERGMFDTRQEVMKGSQTAARGAEDEQDLGSAGVNAAHGTAHMLHGNMLGAARAYYQTMKDLGFRNDKELNENIAKILTDIGIQPKIGPDGKIVLPTEIPSMTIRPQGTP
jgi:hypothetical protein